MVFEGLLTLKTTARLFKTLGGSAVCFDLWHFHAPHCWRGNHALNHKVLGVDQTLSTTSFCEAQLPLSSDALPFLDTFQRTRFPRDQLPLFLGVSYRYLGGPFHVHGSAS